MVRFTEAAEAALGTPVDAVVPLMHRQRAWVVAGVGAYLATTIVLGFFGVHGVVRFAISGAAAGLALTALTRQHLLVLASGRLWLIAARTFRSRPEVLVGEVARTEVTTTDGRFSDVLRIGETRFVLPRLFRERVAELLVPPDGPDKLDDPSSPD